MCGCVCGEFPEWCASGVPWRVTLFVSPVITLHYITLVVFHILRGRGVVCVIWRCCVCARAILTPR
jgi:hypothetical protein